MTAMTQIVPLPHSQIDHPNLTNQFFVCFSIPAEFQTPELYYETSPRGNPILVLNHNRYVRNRESSKRTFWRCTKYYQNSIRCPGSVAISKILDAGVRLINTSRAHNEACDQRRNADCLNAAKQQRTVMTYNHA